MPVLNARQLHNQTSQILSEVSRGQSFDVERHGKVIARISPAASATRVSWDEIMAPVWSAHKKAKGRTPNPVLAERARRRR